MMATGKEGVDETEGMSLEGEIMERIEDMVG